MRRTNTLIGYTALACAVATGSAKTRLMPQPALLQSDSGALVLSSTFNVSTPAAHDARLEAAIARAVRRIEIKADLRHVADGETGSVPLVVLVNSPGQAVQALSEDETYSLMVSSTGIEIKSATDVGAIHGLETLVQLVDPAPTGYSIPAVRIEDSPRYAWRGLMIDCSRHFEPLPVLKRNIDAMAAVKLNVFHWHLVDDQGFRIESKVYPKLTGKGSDGLFYTQQEIRDLVAYARARGIRVVPEIEMPGHSAAWLYAYPELASGTVPSGIRREFGISDTAIDPTRETTYTFIQHLLAEITPLFPDEYVHIGGDETPAPDWKSNPRILAFKKTHNLKDNEALQAYFNTRVLKILSALHKKVMGWDEILTPDLPRNIVVQSWRGSESLAKGARMGYEGVLSAPYYLDAMRPASVIYLADPIPAESTLTSDEKKRILGGELTMWAEHLNETDIDSRIWPRAAAVAERFWSPQNVRDVNNMYERLEAVSLELEALGLTHLQSGDARLRAMAHTEEIDDLRKVASAFEPVSFGERSKIQHTDQLTPLDRFVDAVRPDPPSRHMSEWNADRCVAGDRAACGELGAWFAETDRAIPHAKLQAQASPQMQDIVVRIDQLHELVLLGEKAANARAEGKKQQATESERRVLDDARKPAALVRFTFLNALYKLLGVASEP